MANLNDYLDWRGDLTLERDPFNAVDNIVLCQITYTDYDKIVPEPSAEGGMLSLKETARRYFEIHTDKEIKARVSFFRDAPFLMRKTAATERFSEVTVSDYVNLIDEKAAVQFAAVTYHLPDGTLCVCYRGTDMTVTGWKEDFMLSYDSETVGQRSSVEYLDMVGKKYPGIQLLISGHSKGGNLAVYAAALCDPEVQKRIRRIYVNDAPGFSSDFLEDPAYRRVRGRIESMIPEGSMFGTMFGHDVQPSLIRSSAKNDLFQHDLMSWKVMGNRLLPGEKRRGSSLSFETTFRTWLAGMNAEERKTFVSSVFSVVESTGASTLPEIPLQAVKEAAKVIGTIRHMPKEEQDMTVEALRQYLQTSANVRIDEMKEWISRQLPGENRGAKADDDKKKNISKNKGGKAGDT